MKSVLRFPASFQSISASEAAYIIGGAEVDGVTAFLDNVSKLSKLFNYMARVFSATSAMLNNFRLFVKCWGKQKSKANKQQIEVWHPKDVVPLLH